MYARDEELPATWRVRQPMRGPDRVYAQNHLKRLAKKHRVKLKWLGPDRGKGDAEAEIEARIAHLPDVWDPVDYLVGLHELGHIVSKLSVRMHHTDKTVLQHELACEAAAWGWAFEVGDPELLDLMRTEDWDWLGEALTSFPKHMLRRAAQARSVAERVD